eukprot:CAMPEP_0172566834 /NCGR_PEP_ID=MMETSP1067-20121228/113411_1 /TAXON_ID=265564 ORGANISM="Thalassiosira punctigera, Strain Tpunct2005C2" /NCGR_SAMPLE_ID=MMETSP1067 /ASSEMBLY_ACC=CAM_ASM_000444 /LENGTH=278 /DNA_ID=CAMNT_0013358041 /DNA_START=93 /DNA_END=929 /DNA_ORIENTATION=-
MIGFAAGMEMADMAWEVKCREEDMKQRALENERHAIDDARRAVDEKAQQLQVLANQSALFAGFSMVVLVESSIPPDVDPILLTVFGGVAACVIALMLISSLNSTYMLVAILRYDCVNRDVPFDEFWRKRCEPDWKLALRAFSYGVPLFMVVVALVSWLSFWESDARIYAATIVTVVALVATIFWFGSTERKWTGFLMTTEARVVTRGTSFAQRPSTGSKSPSEVGESEKRNGKGKRDADDDEDGLDDSLNISSLAIGNLTCSEMNLNKGLQLKGMMRK